MSAPPSTVTTGEATSRMTSWLAGDPRLRMFQALVRRELWEHRSLWVAPLAVSFLLVISALVTHGAMQIDATDSAEWLDPQTKATVFALAQWGLTIPHYLVMLLVLNFYLLDCLYGERKDRSILFWKSLPVSDGVTVASKAFVGCILVPFGTFALAMVTDLLFTAVWDLRAALGNSSALVVWDTVAFLKTQALMFLGLVVSLLWYAPFMGIFLLASAWVKRNVLMWVTVVPLLAVIVERIAFGTHYLYNLIAYRGDGVWFSLNLESAILGSLTPVGQAAIVSIPAVFDRVMVWPAFTNIDLWLGLVFALACGYAAARIRRYREEA
jgi:ABC-2 type transport system permease protein